MTWNRFLNVRRPTGTTIRGSWRITRGILDLEQSGLAWLVDTIAADWENRPADRRTFYEAAEGLLTRRVRTWGPIHTIPIEALPGPVCVVVRPTVPLPTMSLESET